MRIILPSAAALAVASVRAADADSTASELRLNGWFACGASSSFAYPTAQPKPFECAEVDVPLCYEGVCDSDRTISLFVKRLLANATEEAETSKSLWMLQGGPGGSSVAMESSMLAIHRHLEYKANLYTVDHRGTGRSFFLQCDAAQAFTSGSPTGVGLSADEAPDCLRDVLFQIDNQTAAFSVTSAAKDMEFLVQNLHEEDEEVYIYGASYGTYQTERVMHLAPSNVKGYILDGVMAEDEPSLAFTSRNTENITPTKRLAQYCEGIASCAAMFGTFKKGELYTKWQEIYDELDALTQGKNACADYFRYETVGDEATMVSSTIKYVLGPLANIPVGRILLPGMLKLIHRCTGNDLEAIRAVQTKANQGQLTMALAQRDGGMVVVAEEGEDDEETQAPAPAAPAPQAVDVIAGVSPILSFLIKASELWASPSPSWADEMEVFKDAVFPQAMAADLTFYCMFKGDWADPSCDAVDVYEKLFTKDLSEVEPVAFTYETDEYFETVATIPDDASVLVINGKLDFQTMSDHGVHQFEMMEGGRGKMMVEMDYGGHCSGIAPVTVDDKTECGHRIIASFVEQSGDVEAVDTSCMEELKTLFLPPADMIVEMFGPKTEEEPEGEDDVKKAKNARRNVRHGQ